MKCCTLKCPTAPGPLPLSSVVVPDPAPLLFLKSTTHCQHCFFPTLLCRSPGRGIWGFSSQPNCLYCESLHLCWMYEFEDRKFASNSNRLYTQLRCCRVLVPWHWLPLVCISYLYRIGGHTVYGHSRERLWLLLRRWFGLPVLWGDWWRASSSGLLFFVCRPRVTCVAV